MAKVADEIFQSELGGRREAGIGRGVGGGAVVGTRRREGGGRDSWVLLGVPGGSLGGLELCLGAPGLPLGSSQGVPWELLRAAWEFLGSPTVLSLVL